MSHEISQLDIAGIQLRDSKTQPKVSLSREIGEAQIVHNIFGKARVRIIRKHDAFWRSMWLAFAFVAAATSIYLLQNWYTAGQAEFMRIAVPVPGHTEEHESVPANISENIVAPSAAKIEPAKPSPAEIAKPVVAQKIAPPPQAVMNPPAKEASKPAVVAVKPVMAPPRPVAPVPATVPPVTDGKLQIPAVVAGGTAAKPQVIPPSASRQISPKQPAASAVAAAVPAKVAVPASSPVAAPAQAQTLKEDSPTVPVVGKPLSSPVEPGN